MSQANGKIVISTLLDNGGLEKGIKGISGKLGGLTKVVIAASAAMVAAITKQAVDAYADYEQLIGGVETMFKNSADKVKQYAENAFYTAGVSANEYMQTVTSFSASLINSLGGDTEKAADVANMALIDMADNANKFGTSLESVQSAYQGFAKGQYMLLDNLKLGYGGTKTEMERLLRDAEKISGVKYNINNLSDVYNAIHVIQDKLGVTGATAAEAEKTITGSANMTKAAWKDVLTAIAGGGDLDKAINNLAYSISKYFENIVPVVERAIAGIGTLIERIAPQLVQSVARALIKAIPSLLSAVFQMLAGLASGIYQGIIALLTGGSATTKLTAQLNDVQSTAAGAADAENELAAGIGAASKAAKKATAGFDELNILQDNSTSGSDDGVDLSISSTTESAESANGNGIDNEGLKTAAGYIQDIAEYIPVITAGFAGIKLGSFIADLLTANVKAKTLKETISSLGKKVSLTAGITLAITGITLEVKGIIDTIQEGLNGINFAEIVVGGGSIIVGGALIGKFFGSAILGGAIGGIVAGIPAFAVGIYDAIVNGIDWLNAALIGVGATTAGAGIGAIIGMLGGPIGAGIGAIIGLAVGLVTDLVILIVQNWDAIVAWCGEACAAIGQFFDDLWQGIVDIWNVCAEWFNTNVIQPVVGFFVGLWEGISTAASECWAAIVEFFTPAFEWFSQLFGSIWQTISDIFYNIGVIASGCWEIIKAVWAIVSEWFNKKIIQPVAKVFSNLWTKVSNLAVGAWNKIKTAFSAIGKWINTYVIKPVSKFFSGLWDGFLKKAKAAWTSVKTVFGSVASFFKNTFKKAWSGIVSVFSKAGEIFKDIKDGILSAFKKIVNGIIKGLNSAIALPFNGINEALKKIRDIKILGLTPFSGLKTINVPQIPYLAQGAVLPPNKPFMAVVGDQKHGTNVEAPLETIKQALAEVMATQGTGDINIHFTGDLAQLARILKPVIEKEDRRVGGSMVRKVGV